MVRRVQRAIGRAALAAVLGGGIAGAYAALVEPRWLEVTRTRVRIDGLPPALEGLRIALLTDFHAHRMTPLAVVRRACRRAMAEQPDLIALTGDFGGATTAELARTVEVLAELQAPLGVFGVPGNHDHDVGIGAWHRLVEDAPGLVDLTNRFELRRVGDACIGVAGVDTFVPGDPHPEKAIPVHPPCEVTILLAHNPDQVEAARAATGRVDLVLSGHTHGGQVRLPLVGALLNPARHDRLYDYGLVRRPWTQVYVSRGVGTVHLPVRFLCRPEVAILMLTRAPDKGPEERWA